MAADRPQRARRAPLKLTEQAAVAGVPVRGRKTQKQTPLTTRKPTGGRSAGNKGLTARVQPKAATTAPLAHPTQVTTQSTPEEQPIVLQSSPPPLLPQQPLQQPEGLEPAVDPPALPERPVTPRALPPTLHRSASISSLPPQPEFDVEVDYKLIVNGKSAVHRAPERHDRFMWWLDDVEKVVNEMLEQPEARLNGRDYEIESRTVGFRAGIKTRKVLITLADFSQVEEIKLHKAMDYQVSKTPGVRLVEVSVEVRVRSRALEKAFKRNQSFNEPSSDIGEAATPLPERNSRRQQQLLNEARAIQRVDSLASAQDWERHIHKHWLCRNSECTNFENWCWVTPSFEHYAIAAADSKSWANAIVAGQAELLAPPVTLIDYWRSPAGGGNQLKRRRGKKKRRDDSDSDESDDEKEFWRNHRLRERKRERQRAEDEARWRDERHELLKLQRDGAQLQSNLGVFGQPAMPVAPQVANPPYPVAAAYPQGAPPLQLQQLQQYYSPLPSQRPRTPGSALAIPVPSSSPVSGQEDTRATVRDFFNWLVAQQPEEDRYDYQQAQEVAISEKWTIKDLKEMSNVSGELYKIAVSERFKLKDGVVRHLQEDLKKFKQHCKAAAAAAARLVNMGSGGVVGGGVAC